MSVDLNKSSPAPENNNSFSVLLAAILLGRRCCGGCARRHTGRISPSALRLSPTVTASPPARPFALYLLTARAPDMQLWFNLIFASDTDRVLAGRRWRLGRKDEVGTKSKLAFRLDRGQDGAGDDLMPNVVADGRSYGAAPARWVAGSPTRCVCDDKGIDVSSEM